jgi:hypothetical protein
VSRFNAWFDSRLGSTVEAMVLSSIAVFVSVMCGHRLARVYEAENNSTALTELSAKVDRHYAELNELRLATCLKTTTLTSQFAPQSSGRIPLGLVFRSQGESFDQKWAAVRNTPPAKRARAMRELADELRRSYVSDASPGPPPAPSAFERGWDAVRDYTIKQRHEGSGVSGPAVP